MKYSIKIMYIALFMISASNINAQTANISQKKIEHSIAKVNYNVVDACIKLVIRDTVNNRDFGGFSGVIVSPRGLILTAAHSVNTGHQYRAEFANGKKTVVIALGRIALEIQGKTFDLAMLKILDSGVWPYAKMADSRNINIGEGCVGISYPGTFFQTKPNLRYGIVTNSDDADGFIKSTCKMEPGDSGGGLFDLNGELIGIRDKIDTSEDVNFDIPINLFRKYWTALHNTINYQTLPPAEALPPLKFRPPMKVKPTGRIINIKKSIQSRVATINSNKGNTQRTILATPLDVAVKRTTTRFWLSKNSVVGSHPWMVYQGRKVLLEIVGRDIANDLVLLKEIGMKIAKSGIKMNLNINQQPTIFNLGRFIISPISEQQHKIGVLSTLDISLPLRFSQGKLGALIENDLGKLTVRALAPTFPAEKALKIGDQIIKFNDLIVKDMDQYKDEMSKVIIGDEIKLNVLRDGKELTILIPFPERKVQHISANYEGERSFRSDGFEKVLIQDAAIRSDQCGGPAYDIDDNFIGINIARHSRTATVIMPVDVIRRSIIAMLK